MNLRFLFACSCLVAVNALYGQTVWDLNQCIEYAAQHNLVVQQADLSVELAEIDVRTGRHRYFPDLTGSLNGGISFGRNIDPTTNSFTTENILYSNYSLSSSVVLFQSGSLRNASRQERIQLSAAREDRLQSLNDLGLSIASFYLNVLLAGERLEVAVQSLETQRLQQDQAERLFRAGLRPEAELLEWISQTAMAEQGVVAAENGLDLAWLQLRQAMRLPMETDIQLQGLREEQLDAIAIERYAYEDLIAPATENQASIRAAKLRLDAAKIGEKIARATFFPTVYMSGSIGSRFSDAAIRPTEYGTTRIIVPGVYIDGKPAQFEQDYPTVLETEVTPFGDQFDQFLGYGAGISVSIPIYRNNSARGAVQRAKISTRSAALQLEQRKEALDQNVFTAIANFKSAGKDYDAALKAFDASKRLLESVAKKLELGTASAFEFNVAQTSFQSSSNNLLIAKYELVFHQKVLDYYAGKKLTW
ncbi:MAG: TolC family protein [Saprospiraceae bacterium]|nr:TolC family protein [Saprospiraceae bacterium]